MINYWTITPLIAFGLNVLLIGMALRLPNRRFLHLIFTLFLTSMGLWALATFGMRISERLDVALIWEKAIVAILPMISVFFLHFILVLTGDRRKQWLLRPAYFLIAISIGLSPTGLVVAGMRKMWYGNGLIAGPLEVPSIVIFYAMVIYALYKVMAAYHKSKLPLEKSRLLYIFTGGLLCLFGLSTDIVAARGVWHIYPLGIVTNGLFCLLTSYAMLRLRLLDFRIALRRGTTYAIVSTIAFGLSMTALALIYFLGTHYWGLTLLSAAIVIMVLSMLLQPLLRYVQNRVDRWFDRGQLDYLQALENIGKKLKSIDDLQKIAYSLVNSIQDMLNCRSVTVLLPDSQKSRFSAFASIGTREPRGISFSRDSMLVWWLEQNGTILASSDLIILPHFSALTLKERDILNSLSAELFVPLIEREGLRGIIVVGRKLSDRAYSAEEIKVLQIMAEQVAITLDNALLYDQQVRRYKSQELMAKLSSRVSAELNLDKLYPYFGNELVALMPVDYLDINLKQKMGQPWARVFNITVPDALNFNTDLSKNLPLDEINIISTRETYYHYRSDPAPDAKLTAMEKKIGGTGIRSLLCLPLISENDHIGNMVVASLKANAYDDERITLLGQVATQLAIAIKKSRLFESDRKARLDLEKRDQERRDFVNALIHEINTPLTPIRASSELLREELEGKGTLGELAESLDMAARNLGNRLDELMDFANLQTERTILHLESLDIYQLARAAAAQVVPLMQIKNQKLDIDLPSQPVMVKVDPDRLTQILLNLLNNASKYTAPGLPISLASYQENSTVVIEVSDSARPITSEEQAILFQPYKRLGAKRTSGGMGLGLSISKSLAELHGGRIWIEPNTTGNIFKFSLPVDTKVEETNESIDDRR